ncbi:MAG TPA: sigma-70 family RNA polymerase sigma factor [Chloroflexia bacterium]|nr:sigma-70 family RNA polymerase sigma factor [Chloroflexia bacterium]
MSSKADEQTWIERAREGDVEAVGYLYELYADRIYRFALFRLANHTDAEDVTEQVFVKMIEHISGFHWNGSGSFAAWLYRMAYNQVIDAVRVAKRHPEVDFETLQDRASEDGIDPQTYAEQQDFLGQVKTCMEELTDLQLQVILLKYGADMSNAEVAEMLDRTVGTVATVQHQTLQKLKGLMRLKGYKTYKK